MPKKVIFITAIGHSGSTLLDLVLGTQPHFVGLGEVFKVLIPNSIWLEKTHEETCSCGSMMDKCYFWSRLISELKMNNKISLEEKYNIVLKIFDQVFGEDKILVDSSKHLKALKLLTKLQNQNVDVKIIHLIRDVRAFTISMLYKEKKKLYDLNKISSIEKVKYFYYRRPSYYFWRWYLYNKKIQTFVKENKMQYFQLGYEEICFYPEKMIKKLLHFFEEKRVNENISLNQSSSHNVLGNRMSKQAEKRQRIYYDNRWFYRNEWSISATLFPNIMKYNSREVYINNMGTVWEK